MHPPLTLRPSAPDKIFLCGTCLRLVCKSTEDYIDLHVAACKIYCTSLMALSCLVQCMMIDVQNTTSSDREVMTRQPKLQKDGLKQIPYRIGKQAEKTGSRWSFHT